MDRRQFFASSSFFALTGLAMGARAGTDPAPAAAPPGGLRTISYNVLACRGFPKTRANKERLDRAGEGMAARFALELSLYAPGIVTFQESPFAEKVARIAGQMGMNYVFFPGGWEGDSNWPGGFPGTVMTRFAIVEHENCPLASGKRPEDLFTRHWGRAVIKTDNEELSLYSAHLHPNDKGIREQEITQILKVLEPDLKSGRSLLLQGDLNHAPSDPEYKRWVDAGLLDALPAKGDGTAHSSPSTKPRSRIDYIWAHGPLADRLSECRVLFEGAFRTNPDDPQSFALSDHVPVLACFD